MRQLQLMAQGEPSDVIELNTVSEPVLGQEDVLISMEAAPMNPSDFLFARGIYGVRAAFPSSVGAEGVGRVAKIGSKVDPALRGKRVLILPTYEQGTWADEVVVSVRSLVLDTVGGTPVGELALSLKPGGSIFVYALQSGQFPTISPGDFIYRGLSLHGFWLINWIRNAPRTEIKETYQKLGDLVADGSLSAAVEHVYPLNQFKEAFKQSLKSNRSGKILFQFGATNQTDRG